MGKKWYASKVVWLNVVTTIALTVEVLTAGQIVPLTVVPYLTAAVAILNIILRVWFVDQPLTA